MTAVDLSIALDPRSVAIVGASENPNKIGGRPLLYLNRFGFRGKIYPINSARPRVQGYATYPDLDALPEVPDLVIVAVPGDAAVETVEACALRGVKIAVVMTSGFGETSAPEGRAKERRMVAAARAGGMRMVGPNSQGLANFGTGAVASFSTMFLEEPPADGPIAVISQSGSMSVVPYGLLRQRGLGVRHTHATGNDADVTVAELAAAADDVRRALQRLRMAPLFAGVRGEPALDVDAFCAAAVAVGSLMLEAAPRTLSLDCNPVLLGAAGEGYVVVDALAIVE